MSNITKDNKIFETKAEMQKHESNNNILHPTGDFVADVVKVLFALKTPNVFKIVSSFIKSSTIIFISGIVFYFIDLVVAPIAKFLVGY